MAILDTGLFENPDLAPFVTGRYDAVNPERDMDDRQGHGTQMALIASGASCGPRGRQKQQTACP